MTTRWTKRTLAKRRWSLNAVRALAPSINTTQNRMDFENHWHGYITNGEVT